MENTVQQPAWRLLRRAAKTLRTSAQAATPGPWDADVNDISTSVVRGIKPVDCGVNTCIQDIADLGGSQPVDWSHPDAVWVEPQNDARYIALMHPPVALALAALFEQHAAWLAQADDDTPADADDLGDIGHVVEVAKTVLRIGGAR